MRVDVRPGDEAVVARAAFPLEAVTFEHRYRRLGAVEDASHEAVEPPFVETVVDDESEAAAAYPLPRSSAVTQ